MSCGTGQGGDSSPLSLSAKSALTARAPRRPSSPAPPQLTCGGKLRWRREICGPEHRSRPADIFKCELCYSYNIVKYFIKIFLQDISTNSNTNILSGFQRTVSAFNGQSPDAGQVKCLPAFSFAIRLSCHFARASGSRRTPASQRAQKSKNLMRQIMSREKTDLFAVHRRLG